MDWQPIETAPKDGRIIIVADADVGCFAMRWEIEQRNSVFAPGQVGMWVSPGGEITWSDGDGFGPSFWMAEGDYSPGTPFPPVRP